MRAGRIAAPPGGKPFASIRWLVEASGRIIKSSY
jgi:hypothetical protein